jgi:hypothetical protein
LNITRSLIDDDLDSGEIENLGPSPRIDFAAERVPHSHDATFLYVGGMVTQGFHSNTQTTP